MRLLAKSRGVAAEESGELAINGGGGELRGDYLHINMSQTARLEVFACPRQKHGMRNSNCIAIAPTATIANIVGVTASIEPTYQNIYVKSNLSGDFTVSTAIWCKN